MLAFLRVRTVEGAMGLLVSGEIRRSRIRLATLAAFIALGFLGSMVTGPTLRSAVGDDQRINGVAGGHTGLESLDLRAADVRLDVLVVELIADSRFVFLLAFESFFVFHQ